MRRVSLVDGRLDRGAPPEQQIDVELEDARRVQPQDLRALDIFEMSHLALDRLCRMWPRAFGMRVVVGPQKIIDQVKTLGELESGRVFLKRRGTVAAKIIAGASRRRDTKVGNARRGPAIQTVT